MLKIDLKDDFFKSFSYLQISFNRRWNSDSSYMASHNKRKDFFLNLFYIQHFFLIVIAECCFKLIKRNHRHFIPVVLLRSSQFDLEMGNFTE